MTKEELGLLVPLVLLALSAYVFGREMVFVALAYLVVYELIAWAIRRSKRGGK